MMKEKVRARGHLHNLERSRTRRVGAVGNNAAGASGVDRGVGEDETFSYGEIALFAVLWLIVLF